MTRLPINLFLYTCSLGLALGCGWTFYQTLKRSNSSDRPDIIAQVKERSARGREQTPDDVRNDYAQQAWWKTFQHANFIGKPPPEPTEIAKGPVETTPPPAYVPLEDIFDVVMIVYSSTGDSRCAVRYKPTADVQPPAELGAGGAVLAGPGDVTPQGRPNRPNRPTPGQPSAMPSFGGGTSELVQILRIDESLWPSYQHIKLARVAEDGLAVYFTRDRGGPSRENGAPPAEEKMFCDELNLGQEVLAQLHETDGGTRIDRPGTEVQPAAEPSGRWRDVERTERQADGNWIVSRKDTEYIGENASRVFTDDIGVESYRSSVTGSSGLKITRVSPRMAQFGVQSGDVIMELNGVPVGGSKAKALKLGKDLYKQGVRDFRAKIMTRWGKVEERSYTVPD